MKTYKKLIFIFTTIAVIAVSGCTQNPDLSATPVIPTSILATSTPIQSPSLQLKNDFPLTQLSPKRSRELEDNRIGDVAETEHIGPRVWNAGTKWMRVIIDSHGQWQHVDWDGDEYAIDPDEEMVIDNLVSNRIKIMLVLDVWHNESRTVYYRSEEDIATYTNWVRFVVRHFKGRIEYYEILNEPNLDINSPTGMPVDKYVNLAKQTIPVIREEDPDAKIVVGAVPDTRFNDARSWIWGLLNSEIMPLVDGFSWHAMYGAAPSDDPRGVREPEHPQVRNYWENYPAYVEEIKSVAASNGFEGEFLTEEMRWRTPNFKPHETEPYGFTDVSAAKYYARAIIIHLGLDVAPGLAVEPEDVRPSSHSVIRALSTVMAGAQPVDLPVVIESDAINIKYYWFTLSNGDKLLAIWTDGVAVDDDPGIPITLTFPYFSAERVTCLDVLNGLEQQVVTDDEGGNLVIHGFLVKDYPIILKFINVSLVEILEHSPHQTPTTESIPGLSFAGTWQGNDPDDESTMHLILTQTGNQVEGTFSDTFSKLLDGSLIKPGFSGQGSGSLVSPTEAKMLFDLTCSDGASINLNMRLLISLQNNTLTLEIPQSSTIVLHRQ